MNWKYGFFALGLLLAASCQPSENWQAEASDAVWAHRSMKRITDAIVHDILSPPVASRVYAYVSVAGYEALRPNYPQYQSLSGQLSELAPLPQPEEGLEYCLPFSGVQAMLTVGKALVFSEDYIAEFEQEAYEHFKKLKVPVEVLDRSQAHGRAVGKAVLAWADKDRYREMRSYPKYDSTQDPAKWRPTPPDYMDGIEPHWNKLRPFTLQSPDQFAPAPPTPFDTREGSPFYEEALEVYRAIEASDKKDRLAIAAFWDCNPYVSSHSGHIMYASKKITPGGHWIGITEIACRQSGADMMKSLEAYSLVSIALADAFISCWDEKYRSSLVRPETYIQLYIDKEWRPALQTPPFPEHTSGHSVISTAAALALTRVFGEPFPFEDTVELEYGLPARTFNSFNEAAAEAALSRFYGGIHYQPAIDYGVEQGMQVGRWVLDHVETEIKSK
jgi:hypothetical protein